MIFIHIGQPTFQKTGKRYQIEHATAEWRGQVIQANSLCGIIGTIARALIDAGADPSEPWRAFRRGALLMHGPSIGRAAGVCVTDADRGQGPRFAKWKPRTDFFNARALEAADEDRYAHEE